MDKLIVGLDILVTLVSYNTLLIGCANLEFHIHACYGGQASILHKYCPSVHKYSNNCDACLQYAQHKTSENYLYRQ